MFDNNRRIKPHYNVISQTLIKDVYQYCAYLNFPLLNNTIIFGFGYSVTATEFQTTQEFKTNNINEINV